VSEGANDWWRDAVVYQVYPRSFQDSDDDGVGDLRGVVARLDHLAWLGADAVWLSPFYPSPGADCGYDISDFTGVDPELGTLADADELIAAAHRRGLRVLLDLVPSHTSIEHPWFREHPERYVWADGGPPNNWVAAFGGPAWTRDERTGRWYLHSFYPEQPDLDWRRADVRKAIGDVIRFWRGRGVDGFRVDAVQALAKDPELRDDPPATAPFALPLPDELTHLDLAHSRAGHGPGMREALDSIRAAAGDAYLVGEVYLPTAQLDDYLEHFEQVFAFEFLHAPRDAQRLAQVIRATSRLERAAWVLSNHDFTRLATRFGESHARAAAMMLLTLPGAAFVYQGDEIGMADGPGASPPVDRHGRDGFRHPMQWDGGTAGGFSSGTPWLEPVDPARRSVAGQAGEDGSMLELYRSLISLRPRLGPGITEVEAAGDVLGYRRGEHVVALNLGEQEARLEPAGELVLSTNPAHRAGALAPGEGIVRDRTV
jgi:alpha-glucosidase